VLIYDGVINDLVELIPTLELVREQGGGLLVVAENIAEEALPGLLLNHIRKNLCSIAVKGPGYGDSRYDFLLDHAALTGGRGIMEAFGEDSELLGKPFSAYDLLINVSSTVGRAYTLGTKFTITSELMGLDRALTDI
jgi:hypothetical protein